MILTLPVPPSANRYWRIFRNRAVRSLEAEAYAKAVWAVAWPQRKALGWPVQSGVRVVITWYRAQRKGDLDNRLKVTLDALQGIAYEDDAQIRRIEITMSDDDRENARLEVEVAPWGLTNSDRGGRENH